MDQNAGEGRRVDTIKVYVIIRESTDPLSVLGIGSCRYYTCKEMTVIFFNSNRGVGHFSVITVGHF